jgi:hypothetical protein
VVTFSGAYQAISGSSLLEPGSSGLRRAGSVRGAGAYELFRPHQLEQCAGLPP